MPPRRKPVAAVVLPPPIPDPRPDFLKDAAALPPLHHHDFSSLPLWSGAVAQRFAVLCLVLRLDALTRAPKYSPYANDVAVWVFPRLLQLEAHWPLHRGDVYHLLNLAPSASPLSRRTQDLLVDFVQCENLADFVHARAKAGSTYPTALVLSWGGGSSAFEAVNVLPPPDIASAATFITHHAPVNGGPLIGGKAFFWSHIDFGPPVDLNEALVTVSNLQDVFDKVYPGVKVHLAGGHVAGRSSCRDLRLVIAVPAADGPVDPDRILQRLKPALTSKNDLQPLPWIMSPTTPWDDYDLPLAFFGSVEPRSIGRWRTMGLVRMAINLIIVPDNQAGAAQFVLNSPPSWLASCAEALKDDKGYQLTAAGCVPLREGLADVFAPTEADIFTLLGRPFVDPQARQCGFPSVLHLSSSGAPVSIVEYAPGGPIFSPSTSDTATISRALYHGFALLAPRETPAALPDKKRKPKGASFVAPDELLVPHKRNTSASTTELALQRSMFDYALLLKATAAMNVNISASTSTKVPPPVQAQPAAPARAGHASTSSPASNQHVAPIMPTKQAFGPVGIVNLGDTCYAAALLQALKASSPELTDLTRAPPLPTATPPVVDLIMALRDIMSRLSNGVVGSPTKPHAFLHAVRAYAAYEGRYGSRNERPFQERRQHDPTELFHLLSDGLAAAVHGALVPISATTHRTLTCIACNTTRSVDPVLVTTLPLPLNPPREPSSPSLNLMSCIREYLGAGLDIVDVQCTVEECPAGGSTGHRSQIVIETVPDILVLTLLRFEFHDAAATKNQILVQYPLVLVLPSASADITYDLAAVVFHTGQTTSSGHYYTTARAGVGAKWYTYNDTTVTPHADAPVPSPLAYLLFYRRRSSPPS